MKIIKVNATESSNTFAREWYQANKNSSPACIWVGEQTAGRGQRGASWYSQPWQNLTFSVVYPNPKVDLNSQFLLSQVVGLAVVESLKEVKINNLQLKWPNDIMSAGFKIGGILIENILGNGRISASVIGIGLNINQINFPNLPKASSLKLVSGRDFSTEEVLLIILKNLEKQMKDLNEKASVIQQEYENLLFRNKMVSTFELPNGNLLTGMIEGVTNSGLLKLRVQEEGILTFDIKQIKLLF